MQVIIFNDDFKKDIPLCDEIRTDGGTQFQGNCQHIPSSPHYSQSNGEAESAVKIAKMIIERN
uniref:Uncharacterized protein n=1 Tax=Megaselia scalaris TaxID=36166 RepID=T1GAF7_MEGSC